MNEVSIIGAVVIGILAGWIAEKIMGREHGLITNLVVGVVGAFLGAVIANALGIAFAGFLGSLIVSTLGAVVLLAIVGMFRRRALLRILRSVESDTPSAASCFKHGSDLSGFSFMRLLSAARHFRRNGSP